MEEKFEELYTFYFNLMFYVGCWVPETKHPGRRFLYTVYSQVMTAWVFFVVYMNVLDLIASASDLEKLFYNASFSPLIAGSLWKWKYLVRRAGTVDALRKNLFHSIASCGDAEALDIYNSALKDLKFITRSFAALLLWLVPVWLLLSLCSDYFGERQLPLPAKWPGEADIARQEVFIGLFAFHAIFAGIFVFEVLSLDVSLFGLMIQIHREYCFLIKEIREFGELSDDARVAIGPTAAKMEKVPEINVVLKKAKTRQKLGDIIVRQKQLLQFSEDLEYAYSPCIFVHIFVGGALLILNGVQAMIVSSTFNMKICYQYAYVFAILCDMLYLCWLTNRISIKCTEVGTALYSAPWYIMDVDIQKDIHLVILRSQKPPRITAGNFVELNLSTFMGMMKNCYSWLALFRQVAMK